MYRHKNIYMVPIQTKDRRAKSDLLTHLDSSNSGDSQYRAPPAVRLKHHGNHGKKLTFKARIIRMLHGNKCQCLFSLSIQINGVAQECT